MSDVDVLIVGAGPTGLTLACDLARRGVSVRIVEAASGPQTGSRGKGLQPRTLEVFDDLGIVDRVIANGRMAMPIRSFDSEGRDKAVGGVAPAAAADKPYPASLITPEWRVEEALRDRLNELGGKVEFGSTVIGIEQDDEHATAMVETGEGRRSITARWLVGCDGGHSIVRRSAGIPFIGETMEDVRMIVADLAVDGLDRDSWCMWRHATGFLALCPLPSTDLFQLQASIAPGQDPSLTLANMQALLETRTGRVDIRLDAPSWSTLWRANVRMVDRYREGCILLAGDAAHVHSPAGGQGMNTGIQDAYNLGWKLRAVLNGAPSDLVDTYQEERLPVAASVLALSNDLLQRTMAARGIVIERSDRTLQLGLNYRTSSLSRDDRDEAGPLRAGDRAPDAPGLVTTHGERRLFDLFRGEHATLLLFGERDVPTDRPGYLAALPLRTFRVTDNLKHADDIIDGKGHLAAAYDLPDGTAVLIRPDGYIASIVSGTGAGPRRLGLPNR